MSDFISKLQKLLNQLPSPGCIAFEDDDKIFLLLKNGLSSAIMISRITLCISYL